MLPGGVGVGLLLLALVPGWLYLRLRERLRPPSGATGLTELLEVLAVGLATTGAGAAMLAFVPHRWLPFLLDVDAWARLGNDYLPQHIRSVVASVVAVFLVAVVIAYLLYLVQRLQLPAEFRPQGSVWVHALGARPNGRVPWVGLQLNDGRLVEGLLHSYSLTDGGMEERDVALQRPIRVSVRAGEEAQHLNLDRLIVSGREITYIAVVHAPERTAR